MGNGATGARGAQQRARAYRAPGQAGATKTASLTGSKSGGAKAAEPGSVAALHEQAHAWQQAHGAPEAHPTAIGKGGMGSDRLMPVTEGNTSNIGNSPLTGSAAQAMELRDTYGERQLGAALTRYSTPTIKSIAGNVLDETPARANRQELISRITAKLTNGRYSADFAKEYAAAKAQSAAERQAKAATKANAPAKTPRSATSRATSSPRQVLVPILEAGQMSEGRVNGASAYMMRQLYGQSQLRSAVEHYGAASIKQMVAEVQARHPGTKPSSMASKAAMTDYIVSQIGSEGDNLPTSGNGWQLNW